MAGFFFLSGVGVGEPKVQEAEGSKGFNEHKLFFPVNLLLTFQPSKLIIISFPTIPFLRFYDRRNPLELRMKHDTHADRGIMDGRFSILSVIDE